MTPLTTARAAILSCGLAGAASAATDVANVDQSRTTPRERIRQIFIAGELVACCEPKLILPRDHGPRANATPWSNQQRRLRFEASKKACVERADDGRMQYPAH